MIFKSCKSLLMMPYFYWRMQKMTYFYGKLLYKHEQYKLENCKGV